MSQLQRAFKSLGVLALIVNLPIAAFGQSTNSTIFYGPQAGEFAPAGLLPGEQNHPSVAMNATGGIAVWDDNITDGDGLGISAVRLDSTLSPTLGVFRVNQQGTGDQEKPRVKLLLGGGAVFVWQSGPLGFQHIVARFLGSNGLFITGDVPVSNTNKYQTDAALTVLTNGNVVVTWGSYGQDNADGMQGVYGQLLSPTGQKIGGEFGVNQFTPYNQRTPAVAGLPNGNFIVAWVSELERSTQLANNSLDTNQIVHPGPSLNSIDIFGRQFGPSGTALGNEILMNVLTNVCANPVISAASDGSYMVAWSQKDSITVNNSWDIWGRIFNQNGVGGVPQIINTQVYGDQYCPQISSIGTDYFVVWTSMGQDGSREGVYGQFLRGNGTPAGGEIRVNTTVLNQQVSPTVTSDGVGRFLAVWSSYTGGLNSLDLSAQRFVTSSAPLPTPGAPFVISLDTYLLSASWPSLAGFSLSYYELFVDGSATSINVTNNMWSGDYFNTGSTHTFQLAYRLTDGTESGKSPVASATTWGADKNHDGLPDDWETLYYGTNQSKWPPNGASAQLAPGVTLLDVFLWGANPNDPKTWLKQWISQTPQGLFLNWNTVPGGIYQVQTTTDLNTWTNLGSPRFESGATDSIYLGLSTRGYYKVLRNRY